MSTPKTADREGSGRVRFGGSVLRAIEFEPGARVAGGSYVINGVLGRGGMATVYSALRQLDGKEVAFKVLNAKSAARADVEHRLHNERMLVTEVGAHPSIVAALDGGRLDEQDGAPYLVTERVHGPELSYVIATERRLDPMRACRLALDIADGLEALHRHGIAHRDVKPDNILVVSEPEREGVPGGGTANERAKLIDFGLATRIVRDGADEHRVTLVSERPGTPMYMCPEQSMGAVATAMFDVYGLGVTLYEMLAGVTPFAGVTDAELLEYKVHRHAAMDMLSARADVPTALSSLVKRCLAPLPSDRLTLAALQMGLRAMLGLRRAHPERAVDVTELSPRAGAIEVEVAARGATLALVRSEPREDEVAPHPSTPAQAEPRRARNPGRWWIAAACVAGASAVFGSWLWMRADATPSSVETTPTASVDAIPVAAPPVATQLPATTGLVEAAAQALPVPAKVEPPVTDVVQDPKVAAPVHDAQPSPKPIPAKPAPKPKAPLVSPLPAETPKAAPPDQEHPSSTKTCEATRARAEAELDAHDWSGLLQASADASCWSSGSDRARMRVRAFANLRRFQECVDVAAKSSDTVVRRQAEACQKQIEKQREQP